MATAALVSIGIPTYNRAESVLRATRSALAQDHRAIEVVVSDDASSDATRDVLRALAAEDGRLRYLRQSENIGHAKNFGAVLEAATGEYFMWLSDDDWLDPAYVSRCLSELCADPSAVLVCGVGRYHRDGDPIVDERPINLLSARPGLRVLGYFARVNVNGALYGIGSREARLRSGFPDVVGGDWLLVAAEAARGRIRTLPDVHIHRSLSGLSSDPERLARGFGMRGLAARHHHVWAAAHLLRAIAVHDPAYGALRPHQRAITGVLAALLVLVRFPGISLARGVLQRLGLERIEDLVTAWVRRRDAGGAVAPGRRS